MTDKKFSYSRDEEIYGYEEFDSISSACQAAAHNVGVGRHFWVGEVVPPSAPESFWRADDWLEHVSVQDEYGGEHAEDWEGSTKQQREELEAEVHAVMKNWLDRHQLRPTFFNITNAQKFYVAGKVGDVFEIEAL